MTSAVAVERVPGRSRVLRLWSGSPKAARALMIGRAFEQGSLAIATVALGRALGTAAFAAAGTILVVNSLAVALSDYGLGIGVLRLPTGATVATTWLRRVRAVNVGVAVVTTAAGLAIGGRPGEVVLWSGLVWAAAAEAYVRKSAAIRLDRATAARRAEVASSVVLLAAVVAACAVPRLGLPALGAGLLAKHLVEVALVGGWQSVLAADGTRPGLATWGTQVVSAATANLDYLVAGAILGPARFSVYLLGFRVANAFTSQVASVTGRLSFVDFGSAETPARRQQVLDRYLRRLVPLGIAVGALTALGAVPLAAVLGSGWSDVRVVVPVLAIMVPWRVFGHLAGSLTIAVGRSDRLLRWELVRLAACAAVLLAAAPLGLVPFAVAATITWIGAVAAYFTVAARTAGVACPAWVGPAALASALATPVLAAGLALVVR